MKRLAAAGLAALALLAPAAAARAADVPADELRTLAQRAADDPAALRDLRAVDAVDGRPVDVGAALRGATGDDLRRRLALMAGETAPPAAAGPSPRRDAQEVLRDRRYRGTDVPRPFQGVLEWLGRRLRPVYAAVNDAFSWLIDRTPGGEVVFYGLIGAIIALVAFLVARRLVRRRARGAAVADRQAGRGRREDPRELERAAATAEHAGDHAAAVRLRFRAGLLRLGERGAIDYRASLTTGEVAGTLGSEDFERVGETFDEVAYGGRIASADDSAAAREHWRAVLEQR